MSLLKTLSKAGVAAAAAVGTLGAVSPGLAGAATTLPTLPSSGHSPQYGVLIADPTYETSDYNAGVRLAIVSVHWSSWEPAKSAYSSSYEAQEVSIVKGYLSKGYTVGINPGLNTAPSWAYTQPGMSLVDQHGNSSGTPNYEYSAAVRSETGGYLKSLVSTLPASTYFMIGYGSNGELEYPSTTGGQWWAFDKEAQGTAAGVVSSVGVSPMPGWIPGSSTWDGKTVTATQVQSWYNWYLGADINLAQWEMSTVRSAGFNGYFQIKMPGTGANPWVYSYRLAHDLAATSHDSFNTLNVGQVWQKVIPALAAPGVVVNVTSVGDGSGSPENNACTAADASVNYQTNSAVDSWSSIRWQTYLAGRSGLPVIGESVGQNSAAQMTEDLSLMHSCGLIGMEWAFDYELYSGQYATISDYAKAIGNPTFAAVGVSVGSYTFSTRAVGTTSAPLNVALQDTGTAPLIVSSDSVTDPAFAITADTCKGKSIAPGATCAVSLSFTPQAWGNVTSALTFTTNASNSPKSVTLVGDGSGPVLRVGSGSLNLGVALPHTTSPARTVTVLNHGASPLHVATVTTSGAGFAVASNGCAGVAVPVNGSCTIGVTFDPSGVGSFTGTLDFTSDANDSPNTVALTGIGGAPAVTLAETSYTFGTTKVGVTTPAETLSLENTGNEPLTVSKVAGSGTPFTVVGTTCTAGAVAPGAHCSVTVTFQPTTVAQATGRVSLSDGLGTQKITLIGTGQA